MAPALLSNLEVLSYSVALCQNLDLTLLIFHLVLYYNI